jgi:hypothetical protein
MQPQPIALQAKMPSYGPVNPNCWVEHGMIHVFTASEYAHRLLRFELSTLNELIARLDTEDVTDEILEHINKHMLGQDTPITREQLGLEGQLTEAHFVFE